MNVLKCLSGSDVNRIPGELYVNEDGGRLICPSYYDAELLHDGTTTIRGWGSLDGEAIDVKPEGASWSVSVPLSEFERIAFDPGKLRKSE